MALAEFQNQQNLVNVNDRETTLSSNVTTAENRRRDADVQIRELEKRIEANSALMETMPNRQSSPETNHAPDRRAGPADDATRNPEESANGTAE